MERRLTLKKINGNKVSEWFKKNGRQLPWRETDNPYYILVSEIMLQQTQVTTVIPYYLRFIDVLPTLEALATASEEQLHFLWEGLGYYSRVHRLQQFAIRVIREYQGVIPTTKEQLIKLPGIGPYTVGALLSFAFHIKEPAIDGNVNRVISRLYNDGSDITKVLTKRKFHDYVVAMMDEDPYSFNQGMIELGAVICTPKAPKCTMCPLNDVCEANVKGTAEFLPNKPKKKKQIVRKVPIFIIESADKIFFVQRKQEGLLANMYGFPIIEEGVQLSHTELIDEDNEALIQIAIRFFEDIFGIIINEKIKYIGQAKHVFSHIIWEEYVYLIKTIELEERLKFLESPVIKWASTKEVSIPTAFKKGLDIYCKYRQKEC